MFLRRACLALLLAVLALAGCARTPLPSAPPAALRPASPAQPPLAPDLASWLSNPASNRLPERLPLDRVTADVIALHSKHGGATYNFYFGDLTGQKLYAVSPFPDLGKVLPGKTIPPATLRAFISNRKAVCRDCRYNVGTWYDSKSAQTYLDISLALADKVQAAALGKRFNQIAIFDLYAMQEIPTGGTGKALPGWPPPNERVLSIPAPGLPIPGPVPTPVPVPAT